MTDPLSPEFAEESAMLLRDIDERKARTAAGLDEYWQTPEPQRSEIVYSQPRETPAPATRQAGLDDTTEGWKRYIRERISKNNDRLIAGFVEGLGSALRDYSASVQAALDKRDAEITALNKELLLLRAEFTDQRRVVSLRERAA